MTSDGNEPIIPVISSLNLGASAPRSTYSAVQIRDIHFRQMQTQADRPHACVFACYKDDRCQSLNWVISVLTCEFNNRTKEARPEDFIPNADRSYFKRESDRGKYNDEGFDICYQLGDSHATIYLTCSADVFLQFARESAMLKLPKERRLPSELLFLLSPIFHCQKIKDGGYNNITNTNKSFAHAKYACSAGYH